MMALRRRRPAIMPPINEYGDHQDIARMARTSYADATMQKVAPGTWRVYNGHRDGFRITYTPGCIMVHGGFDTVVFRHYQACPTLWHAILWAHRADFCYLMEKSNLSREFDREKTVKRILSQADDEMKWRDKDEDLPIWKALVEKYEWGSGNHRSGAVQMKAAKGLREDGDLCPDKMARMFDDIDEWYSMIDESYPPKGRWAYEAVQIWAATMLHHEPRWHRAWRWFRREISDVQYRIRRGLLWRPTLLAPASGGTLNGSELWVRWKWKSGGESFRAVVPFRAFGISFERIGLYFFQGSNWPIKKPEDEARFAR
jgi:hypothetical protein